MKFSYVSPIGAAGLYCNAVAADFQREGEQREMFKHLYARSLHFLTQWELSSRKIWLREILRYWRHFLRKRRHPCKEMSWKETFGDGWMVYEVVRMGREYKVSMPQYEKAAACFREQGIL